MALGGALGLGLVARDAAALCVAGAAQMALGGALGLGLVARDAAAFCVAGAAQTHIYRRFAWEAWHKLTSTVVLRGRRGTNSHLPSFCMAGVAQTHIYRRFAWQAWHKLTSTVVLRGRRGTDGTGWRAWSWFSRPWRRGTLRGRRGTNSHLPSFYVVPTCFSTGAGAHPVSFLDGGQARVARPDNESRSLCPREPELWPNVGRSECRCLANRHLCECSRRLCVSELCGCLTSLEKPAQLAS